jgi:RNase P subunit RPR2
MKSKLSRKEAQEIIDNFFIKKAKYEPKYVKKTKRLAMKYNIKLGPYRRLFCKKCYSDIRTSKTSINNGYKTTICDKCAYKSRRKIKIY